MLNVELVERHCPKCSRKFKVMSSSEQKYCSSSCSNDYKEGRFGYTRLESKKLPPKKISASGELVLETKVEKKAEKKVEKKVEKTAIEIWRTYVDRAKTIVHSMATQRMEIAKLAIQACEINWGGGGHWSKHEGIHTLKKFAAEIGITYKTLSSYVRTYNNVVSKLPAEIYDESDYAALLRTSNKVSSKTSKEEVVETYKRESKRKLDQSSSLNTMVRRLKTASFWLLSTDISEFSQEDLLELRSICKEIDKKISKHI